MMIKTFRAASVTALAFPAAEVERCLRHELEKAVAEGDVLSGGWEPALDSLRMVSIVVGLETVVGIRLPPEKIVRKGGYKTVDDGIEDMMNGVRQVWQEHHARENT